MHKILNGYLTTRLTKIEQMEDDPQRFMEQTIRQTRKSNRY